MLMGDGTEEKKKKKLGKLAKNSATSAGGGVGLLLVKFLYPQHEGAEKISALLGNVSLVLIVYGLTMLAFLSLNRELALKFNILMVWIIIPLWMLYIFVEARTWPAYP